MIQLPCLVKVFIYPDILYDTNNHGYKKSSIYNLYKSLVHRSWWHVIVLLFTIKYDI